MKVDEIGNLVVLILFIVSMILLISIAVEPFLEPVEIHGVEGEITSVFVTQGKPMFEFNNEAYSFKRLYGLHNIEIKLFTPCEIIFGKSAIWGLDKIISVEYLEVE